MDSKRRRRVDAITNHVASHTYKPTAEFELQTALNEMTFFLQVTMRVVNVCHPLEWTHVYRRRPVDHQLIFHHDYERTLRIVDHLLDEMIRDLELHEIDEWHRVYGRRVREPVHDG